MMNSTGRNHYIIKHNLEALEALPNFIWNSAEMAKGPGPEFFKRAVLRGRIESSVDLR